MAIKILGDVIGVQNRVYSSGDLLGNKMTITGLPNSVTIKETPVLMAITIVDMNGQNAALDIIFFDANPTNTTFTNNAALDIDPADMAKIIGIVKIASADYVPFVDNSAACVYNIGLPLENETMYACLVSRNTPTYLVNGLSLILGLIGE